MNMEWLKNKSGDKFYPITHADGVLTGENANTPVSAVLDNITRTQTEISTEISDAKVDANGVVHSSLKDRLDTMENNVGSGDGGGSATVVNDALVCSLPLTFFVGVMTSQGKFEYAASCCVFVDFISRENLYSIEWNTDEYRLGIVYYNKDLVFTGNSGWVTTGQILRSQVPDDVAFITVNFQRLDKANIDTDIAKENVTIKCLKTENHIPADITLENGGILPDGTLRDDLVGYMRTVEHIDLSSFVCATSEARITAHVLDSDMHSLGTLETPENNTHWRRFALAKNEILSAYPTGKYAKILINTKYDCLTTSLASITKFNVYLKNQSNDKSQRKANALVGKKISIYGDSISTFTGWIPSTNRVYYTGSNCGIDTVDKTWWKQVINKLGLTLVVNNSWSGRCVTTLRDTESGNLNSAGCLLENVVQLKTDTTTPDIIIIKIGVNDWLRLGDSANSIKMTFGTYDGHGAVPSNTMAFRDAYAIMLNNIKTEFPNADVYCCTIMQCVNDRVGGGFPQIREDVNLNDINSAIIEIANLFSVKVLRHDLCGITYFNGSEVFGDWSDGRGLHPNALGHQKMADFTINELLG